jgi:hypothetical protein
MNKLLLIGSFVLGSFLNSFSQTDSLYQNTSQRMMEEEKRLTIGGYAQIDYNQPLNKDFNQNGKLDVHRMVMLFGYKFDKKTSFITEIEYEHVKEVYVEQAFLNYKVNQYINFRSGLLLIPMGIINEYHEPTTYNGVERPNLDGKIVPTTWREIGAGISGNLASLSLKYQLYVVNGFNGYDGSAKFSGSNGLRKGRQKGAESFLSSPNISTKIDYFGIANLKVGLAGYFGKSQSTMFNGLDKNNSVAKESADSSVVGISMLGFDVRYNMQGIEIRGQFNYVALTNTDQYNAIGGTDVGKTMLGYYVEAGYNLFKLTNISGKMVPFVRYEKYNTHNSVDASVVKNDAYNITNVTIGFSWQPITGAVYKIDYQVFSDETTLDPKKQLNMGIGIWF